MRFNHTIYVLCIQLNIHYVILSYTQVFVIWYINYVYGLYYRGFLNRPIIIILYINTYII